MYKINKNKNAFMTHNSMFFKCDLVDVRYNIASRQYYSIMHVYYE